MTQHDWLPFHGVDLETTYTGCFTIGGDEQYFETWWSYPAASGIDSVFKVMTWLDENSRFPLGERKMKIHYHYRDPKRKRLKSLACKWYPINPSDAKKHKYLDEVFGESWRDAVRFHMEKYEQFWED